MSRIKMRIDMRIKIFNLWKSVIKFIHVLILDLLEYNGWLFFIILLLFLIENTLPHSWWRYWIVLYLRCIVSYSDLFIRCSVINLILEILSKFFLLRIFKVQFFINLWHCLVSFKFLVIYFFLYLVAIFWFTSAVIDPVNSFFILN